MLNRQYITIYYTRIESMKMTRTFFALTTTLASVMLAPAIVHAQDGGSSYFGIGVGQTELGADGFDSDSSFQLYGGYMFNQTFGVETGFASYGDFERGAGTFEIDGFYLSGVGQYTVSDRVTLVGEAGILLYGYEGFVGDNVVASDNGVGSLVGVGVNVDVSDTINVGAEFNFLGNIEDTDASTLWLNVNFDLKDF